MSVIRTPILMHLRFRDGRVRRWYWPTPEGRPGRMCRLHSQYRRKRKGWR